MIEVVDSIVSLGLRLDLHVQQKIQNVLKLFIILKTYVMKKDSTRHALF